MQVTDKMVEGLAEMVDRFTPIRKEHPEGWLAAMTPAKSGEWVRHSDYEALERENAKLRAEVERLTPLAVAYDYLEAPDAALSGSGSGWRECATEGCDHPATVHFERGGIGSHYCHACYMRVQKLTAAQEGRLCRS